jgi:hypothetical protein
MPSPPNHLQTPLGARPFVFPVEDIISIKGLGAVEIMLVLRRIASHMKHGAYHL